MTDARRILYVQQPRGGGSATALYDMVRSLDRTRYEPAVLFYSESRYCEMLRDLGAEVMLLGGRATARPLPRPVKRSLVVLRRLSLVRAASRLVRRDWPLAVRMAGRIREAKVDLVHHNDNPRGDRASILAARLAGVPQICHVRYTPKYFRPLDRPLASLVQAFVYVSRAVEEHYRSRVGVPRTWGRVIYDPPHFDEYEVPDGTGRAVRSEFGLSERHRLVTNVGRLVRWKGQDVFLDAFSRIARQHPEAVALIVGSSGGKEREEAYTYGLHAQAEALGLEGRVIFTGFRPDVPAIMAASDIVVHSATEPEPFGRVVVEAMAAGKPVVATEAGGVPESVHHGKTGLLVPPGDTGEMAEAIDFLLSNPERAKMMGEEGKRTARARFDPPRFRSALEQVYAEVLGGRNGRSPGISPLRRLSTE